MCNRPKLLCNSCCIIGTRAEQLIPDERVSASKGRIRANEQLLLTLPSKRGARGKKEQLLTSLPETIPQKKACVVWRVAVTHQTQSLIFLFLLYQNHSDCSECKLSAMWIKIVKSFSFFLFSMEKGHIFLPFFPPFETQSVDLTWPNLLESRERKSSS